MSVDLVLDMSNRRLSQQHKRAGELHIAGTLYCNQLVVVFVDGIQEELPLQLPVTATLQTDVSSKSY